MSEPTPSPTPTPTTCSVEGCDRLIKVKVRQLCGMHEARRVRTGSTGSADLIKVPQSGTCQAEEGCDRPAAKKQLCLKHYQRLTKSRTTAAIPGQHTGLSLCSVEGCGKPHHAGGYCAMHHSRAQRGAPMTVESMKISRTGACDVEGCDDPIKAKRLCSAHYSQKASGRPLTEKRIYAPRGLPCSVEGCDRPSEIEGMCRAHRVRFLAGEPEWQRPVPEKGPNGAGHINAAGYRVISVNGRPALEHRHVAAQLLGRPLTKYEDVHHRNGAQADNRTDGPFRINDNGRMESGNLEIWSTVQPRGQEIGPKVEYALELLDLYRDALTDAQVKQLRQIARG